MSVMVTGLTGLASYVGGILGREGSSNVCTECRGRILMQRYLAQARLEPDSEGGVEVTIRAHEIQRSFSISLDRMKRRKPGMR